MTLLIGQTSAGTTADFMAADQDGWKFTALASGTATSITFQPKVANASETNLDLGIYTDSGGTRPGTRLDHVIIPTPTGSGDLTGVLTGAIAIVSGTVYWLCAAHEKLGVNQFNYQGDTAASSGVFTTTGTLYPLQTPFNSTTSAVGTRPIFHVDGTVGSVAAIEPRDDFEPVRFGPF